MREAKRPVKIYYTGDASSWQIENSDTQAISNQI